MPAISDKQRVMLRSPLRRASALLALILAGGYFGLGIFAATCLFQAAPLGAISPVAHHQHADGSTQNSSHSPLCAWACQASSSSAVGNVVGFPITVFVWWGATIFASMVYVRIAWAPGRPRSPPLRLS